MKRKHPRIVFIFLTCEGCHKRYSAGINPDILPETVTCPGCGTQIEIVSKASAGPSNRDVDTETGF